MKPEATEPKTLRVRTAYWAVCFVVAPFVMAWAVVRALAPLRGVGQGGTLSWIGALARDQPVPLGIAAFMVLETALWAARHRLPYAALAFPPLRADLPKEMHGPLERAAVLVDEAESILERNAAAIEKAVSAEARAGLRASLDLLDAAMKREPFDEEGFVDAFSKAEGDVATVLGRWRKSEAREYARSIVIALAIAMTLRAFVFEALEVPTGSMIPTLRVGDHIIVNKLTFGLAVPLTHTRVLSRAPARGEVIVFAYPDDPKQSFIKRVIAMPGDILEVRAGHPTINGWLVPYCFAGSYAFVDASDRSRHEGEVLVEFLEGESFLTFYDRRSPQTDYEGPFSVKPGEVYVLGDNRNSSLDSRTWSDGRGAGVPFESVRARPMFVWSGGSGSSDWSRVFAPVMGTPPGKGPFGALPFAMKNLAPSVEGCLESRPSIDRTTPPPPRPIAQP